MSGALELPLLFAAGLVAGTLNVLAGGGSFLTLPILIFLGLPPTVANGTNRVGILLQNAGAVWSFDRHGVLERDALLRVSVPAVAGAAFGTWAALEVGDDALQRILAILMVLMSLVSIWNPRPRADAGAGGRGRALLTAVAFFGVGIYGGFIQAGVGFLILGATSLAGRDLVRGNAIKVFTVLCFTTLSLAIFAWQGMVDWRMGLALGVGNLVGGLLGVRLTVLKGHAWLRGVVTVAVIGFAVKLWLDL